MASRRSTLDILDSWLLIVVGIIAAVMVWNIIGWFFGAIFFLVKVAVAAFVIAVAVRLASSRGALGRGSRRRELPR